MQRGNINTTDRIRYQSYAVLIARVKIEGWPWEPYVKLWTVDEDGQSTRSFAKYSEPDKDDNSPDNGSNKPFSRHGTENQQVAKTTAQKETKVKATHGTHHQVGHTHGRKQWTEYKQKNPYQSKQNKT